MTLKIENIGNGQLLTSAYISSPQEKGTRSRRATDLSKSRIRETLKALSRDMGMTESIAVYCRRVAARAAGDDGSGLPSEFAGFNWRGRRDLNPTETAK